MQLGGGDSMDIQISEQYKNMQGLIGTLTITILISFFAYLFLHMSILYTILFLFIFTLISFGFYAIFTHYDKELGRKVIILKIIQ